MGAAVAALLRAGLALGDADELRTLLTAAGFRTSHVQIVVKLMRAPSLAEYLPGYLAATPMAGAIAALEDTSRTALFQELQTVLRPYVDDTGLAVPLECHVVVARP